MALKSGIEFTVDFVNGTNSNTHIDYNSQGVPNAFNITLGRDSDGSSTLLHEFMHAFQAESSQNPVPYANSYDKPNLSWEIESRYAQYTYLTRNPSDPTGGSGWYKEDANISITILDKYIDDQGKLHSGASEAKLNKFITQDADGPKNMLHLKYNGYDQLDMSTMSYGSSNFTNLQTLSKKC